MRRTAASRAIAELSPCLVRDPGWPEDQDEDDPMFCWLPAGHRAAHEWEMRSDLEFTRTFNPTCDTLAGPDGVQFVDLGIYASWCTNLRTSTSWQMISG
jgi:hypothetical protein